MTVKLAEYIANTLVQQGVGHVFGYQGGAILKLVDAMMATGKIKYIQNYHEQASAFCADSYGRVTGNLGVAIATSGPGATNLISGIANAQLDSIPTLFITGQDFSKHILTKATDVRLNGFQDLDIVNIVKPITKYAVAITDESKIRYELEKCIYLATHGRPGAVLIDIPIDLQFKDVNIEDQHGYTPSEPASDLSNLPEVLHAIRQAKRPLILAGGGIHISHTSPQLKEFSTLTNIPVVTTVNGVDAMEGTYSFAGLHGNTFANLAAQNADLLIVLGARLGQQHVGKNPQDYTSAKVIHVDIDPAEFNRVLSTGLTVRANLSDFLNTINPMVSTESLPDFTPWHAQIREWESNYTTTAHLNTGIDPVRAVSALTKLLADDAVITSDVGQNQMWVAQAFRRKGTQRLLNSTGLGCMGYSLPASIGASFARPGAQVICFSGDGGFQMNIQELMFIGKNQLPIKCIVINNNTLGMMRTSQKKYFEERYYGANEQDYACVNLEKIATAYNINYIQLESEEQIPTLQSVLNDNKPYIIEVKIAYHSLLSNRYEEAAIFEKERLQN